MTKSNIKKRFEKLIPEDVDLLFTGKKKLLCSRQAIVNLLSKEIDKAVDKERDRWARLIKEGRYTWERKDDSKQSKKT